MDDIDSRVHKERTEAWKNRFREQIGRDCISSVKGFVVGGCIFDIVDEIWGKTQWKRISDFEEDMEQQYNVYVYRLLRYPPLSGEKKRFLE